MHRGRGGAWAVGEGNIVVAAPVSNAVINTGKIGTVVLDVKPEDGALIESILRAASPGKRSRPTPIRSLHPAFANTVDRDDVVREILAEVASGQALNLYGAEGVGKTYAILRAINSPHPALGASVVYLYASETLEDILQRVFQTWYECDVNYMPSATEVRQDLASVTGVLALDSVMLKRDAAQQLILSLPNCQVTVCSQERILWEGIAIELRGLDREWAAAVIEQELGRPLAVDEREAAARIADALGGSPLQLRAAVGEVKAARRSLPAVADVLAAPDPLTNLAREKLEEADDDRRRLLATLALFGGAPLSDHNLRAIIGVGDSDAVLRDGVRRNDVSLRAQGYVAGAAVAAMRESLDIASAGDRALARLTSWARQHRSEPDVLLAQGEAVLALLAWAVAAGRTREAIDLGRAVDHAFVLGLRFGWWKEMLDLVHAAAKQSGDRRAEAWALHQLGTRAICLGDLAAGAAALDESIKLRREIGDEEAADLSVHNRGLLSRSRRLQGWLVGHSLVLVLVFLGVLALMGGVVAVALQGQAHASAGKATLIVEVAGDGHVASRPAGVDCPNTCNAHFRPSTPVTLMAVASGRSSFFGWRGACSGRGSCIVNDLGTKKCSPGSSRCRPRRRRVRS